MIAKGKYYLANKDRIKKYSLEVREGYYNLKIRIFDLLGSKCKHCGFSDNRALQIDHVHSGGCAEQKKMGTGQKYLNNVLLSVAKGENKYQLLCANCNWIKRFEYNEHSGLAKRLNNKEIREKTLFDF